MTFSIVGYDEPTRSWGVAVASKFLAVGALVPWGRAGVGAIATQAAVNVAYGPAGLALLEAGATAEAAVARMTQADAGREHRQVGAVDAHGRAATFTGSACLDWAGGVAAPGMAVQGNILAGPGVLAAVVDAYRAAPGPLAHRLVAAIAAGDRAGGDARGRQGAAVRVWREGGSYGGALDIAVDLRVDDHAEPVGELARLLDLHDLYFTRPDPDSLLPLVGALAAEVSAALAVLGHDPAGPAGSGGLDAALARWAGVENLEERLAAGRIDPRVLAILRSRAG
ncbi:MAG TPA: DUF1028 domain-containing protein [Mycobacteriales bacterium]|nr:DUF1028 domain-containing protein [Mycobacteriales bacterium]